LAVGTAHEFRGRVGRGRVFTCILRGGEGRGRRKTSFLKRGGGGEQKNTISSGNEYCFKGPTLGGEKKAVTFLGKKGGGGSSKTRKRKRGGNFAENLYGGGGRYLQGQEKVPSSLAEGDSGLSSDGEGGEGYSAERHPGGVCPLRHTMWGKGKVSIISISGEKKQRVQVIWGRRFFLGGGKKKEGGDAP